MAANKNTNTYKDDLSLRDLFLNIGVYTRYLWQKKWWLAFAVALGAAFFIYRDWNDPEIYEGTLSFVVNEDSGGSGGVGSILGQIGLGVSSTEAKSGRIKTLGKSRQILYRALIDSVEVDGKMDLLANHFIMGQNLHEWFAKIRPYLRDYLFEVESLEDCQNRDLRVLKLIHIKVFDRYNPLIVIDHNDDDDIFTITAKTYSNNVTLALLFNLYEVLGETYADMTTGKQKETLGELNVRADSLREELSKVEYALAQVEDRSLGIINNRDRVRTQQLQREAALLNGIYLEVLRNKETAEFLLKTGSPSFEIVDEPALPLASLETDLKISGVLGGALGLLLFGTFFVCRKAYQEIMKPEVQ
ncbi:MAG: hypothetical protein AAGF87_09535 [Bacteroidota bacterium]